MTFDLVSSPVMASSSSSAAMRRSATWARMLHPRLPSPSVDFDETLPGPWEWDVKRLATSLVLVVMLGETQVNVVAVRAFVSSYRKALNMFAELPVLYRPLSGFAASG